MTSILLPKSTTNKLLSWYDRHARSLPWREQPSDNKQVLADPYRVWLSEIMLQQTTVVTVKSYFENFLLRWPTLKDLAAAQDEEVLVAWAGLGYYRRARNLIKCAREVVDNYDASFPNTYLDLLKLPGVGPYTASAIASIAFAEPVAVVDGNVERVITRMAKIAEPLPGAKISVRDALQPIVSPTRPGDMAQAMMDLGATICTPKKPVCSLCPISDNCMASSDQSQELYPVKAQKKKKPVRVGAAFVILNGNRQVWLEKRPNTGLLADMTQVPTTKWSANVDGINTVDAAPIPAKWKHAGAIRHTFTHFHLDMQVYFAPIDGTITELVNGWWSALDQLETEALPKLMIKVIKKAVND